MGYKSWEGKNPDDNPFFYRLDVDYDFLDIYGLEMVKGRKFSEVFAASILIAFLIAQLTVSYHSIKAAMADPIDSLRYE